MPTSYPCKLGNPFFLLELLRGLSAIQSNSPVQKFISSLMTVLFLLLHLFIENFDEKMVSEPSCANHFRLLVFGQRLPFCPRGIENCVPRAFWFVNSLGFCFASS